MVPARNRGLYLALTGMAALLAATIFAYEPVTPLGKYTSPRVFSAFRAKAILKELVGSGVPHPIGSVEAVRIRELLVKRLTALGYATELHTGLVCNDEGVCGSPVNVIAKLAADNRDTDAVLISAHYDSVPAGPGASDDGAGVATVLEIARILAAMPLPRHPIILLLNEGEEDGLLGALLFVREHPLARKVKAAVNVEARGTSGSSVMFETGTANSWAMQLYGSVIRRPTTNSVFYLGYAALPNDTDFTIFKSVHYQGFNFAFIGDVGRYHTALDTWENASSNSIQQQGDGALAVVSALANTENLRPGVAESTFFDVLAQRLVLWPANMNFPAASAVLILLLAHAAALLRKKVVTKSQVLWGAAGAISLPILGVALTAGLLSLLVSVDKELALDGNSWIAHPSAMSCAAAATAFLAAGILASALRHRAGFWGCWIAVTVLLALASVVTALVAPGVSYVFSAPSLAAGVAGFAALWNLANGGTPAACAMDGVAIVPTLALFAVSLPLLQFGYASLGSMAWPIETLLLCFGTALTLPLLVIASGRVRCVLITVTASIAIGGTVVTFWLPTYSTQWPQRINFEYRLDADTRQAHWLAAPASLQLPAEIARTARFDSLPRRRDPGSAALAFYAAATTRSLAPPELSVLPNPLSATPTGESAQIPASSSGFTHYDLRVRSARGASRVVIVFPPSAQIKYVSLATTAGRRRSKLRRLDNGSTRLEFVGLAPQGVTFAVDAAGQAPLVAQIFDQSFALPDGQFLQRARSPAATSSQDGDVTAVHRTVSLDPAAGR